MFPSAKTSEELFTLFFPPVFLNVLRQPQTKLLALGHTTLLFPFLSANLLFIFHCRPGRYPGPGD